MHPLAIKLGNDQWWITESTNPKKYKITLIKGKSKLLCVAEHGYKDAIIEDQTIEEVIAKYSATYGEENIGYAGKKSSELGVNPVIVQLGNGKWWIAKSTNPKKYKKMLDKGNGTLSCIKSYGYQQCIIPENQTIEEVIANYVEKYGEDNVGYSGKVLEKTYTPVVIELKNGKYWIGKSANPESYKARIEEGKYTFQCIKDNGFVSIKIIKDMNHEDTIAFYVKKYGDDNIMYADKDKTQIDKEILVKTEENKNIYVLNLEDDCYYVGVTNNLNKTIKDHNDGVITEWTILHKPTDYYIYQPLKSILEEDYIVENIMLKFGIDKVRGGSYSSIDFDEFQKETLNRKFNYIKKL